MVRDSLTNCCPREKDDNHHSGISGLLSLGAKLHTIADMANIAVNAALTEEQLFHMLFGIAELLQGACAQCDALQSSDIEADVSAMAAKPNTAE